MAKRKGAPRAYADEQTGERTLIAREERPNYRFRPDPEGGYFVMIGALAAYNIEQSDYDKTTLKLIIHLIRTTDNTGLIEATQEELAKRINVSQPSVSRAMKKLLADNHLYKRGNSWFLNPETAFKGDSEQHDEAMRRLPDTSRHLAVVKNIKPGT